LSTDGFAGGGKPHPYGKPGSLKCIAHRGLYFSNLKYFIGLIIAVFSGIYKRLLSYGRGTRGCPLLRMNNS